MLELFEQWALDEVGKGHNVTDVCNDLRKGRGWVLVKVRAQCHADVGGETWKGGREARKESGDQWGGKKTRGSHQQNLHSTVIEELA